MKKESVCPGCIKYNVAPKPEGVPSWLLRYSWSHEAVPMLRDKVRNLGPNEWGACFERIVRELTGLDVDTFVISEIGLCYCQALTQEDGTAIAHTPSRPMLEVVVSGPLADVFSRTEAHDTADFRFVEILDVRSPVKRSRRLKFL